MLKNLDPGAGDGVPAEPDFPSVYRERLNPLISASILRFRLQPESAADLVHEVFVRVFTRKYAPTNVNAWLRKAVFRECVELKEKELKRADAPASGPDLPEPVYDPTEHIEQHILVGQAVGGLEHRSREVLHLHYIEGLTAREIAERMRTTESYVENLISKGLREAKEALMSKPRLRS